MRRTAREIRSSTQTLWDYGVLSRGDAGVAMTINLMTMYAQRDATDPSITALVRRFLREKTDRARIKAAFDWVIGHVRYTGDGFDEYVRSPRHIVTTDWAGDCDDLATLFACFMRAMRFESWFKVIAWRPKNRPENPFTHVYNLVLIPDENIVIPVDCVMSSYGFQAEKKPTYREKIFAVDVRLVD